MTNRTLHLFILSLVIALPASLNAQTVKVFILSGQSNMEGKGNPIHLDTYKNDPLIKPSYASLKDGDGWRKRDDVWITYPSKNGGAKHGPLTVGYGTKGEDSIGPEFGFGHAVGDAIVLMAFASISPKELPAWQPKTVVLDARNQIVKENLNVPIQK